MDRGEDDVNMAFLSVEGVEHHVILTLELRVIDLSDLQSVLTALEDVDIVAAAQICPLKGEIVIEQDSDGGAKESGFYLGLGKGSIELTRLS